MLDLPTTPDLPNHQGKGALDYALRLVSEECLEISMAQHKADRFGLMDINPNRGKSNLTDLQLEVTDLVACIRILNFELVKSGLLPIRLDDEAGIARKIDKVAYYAQHSFDNGRLAEPLVIMTGGGE